MLYSAEQTIIMGLRNMITMLLIESELYNQYNGKKDWFMKFLHRNDYRLEYANDYYIVLAPGDMTKSEDYDYNWYIVGE